MQYNLSRLGITDLNPMQQEMLRIYRRYPRTVLLSPTGTGKSLAYLLPMVEQLDAANNNLQALVIVPSRELAIQIRETLQRLCPDCRTTACYGGRAAMEEHRTLRSLQPQVVVATPGRLLDHLQKGNVEPSALRTLVVDEFDKCLELGFRQQLADIRQLLPPPSFLFLLSATDTPDLGLMMGAGTFHKLDYTDDQAEDRIALHIVESPEKDKLHTLLRLLCTLGNQSSLVFVNYRESAERVAAFLKSEGVSHCVYHGNMEQRDREKAIYRFSNGSCRVMVSTDLASRGLDIQGIDNVIHYHLPLDEKAFVHRNGRTGRWDAHGRAFLLLGPEENCPDFLPLEPPRFGLPAHGLLPLPSEWVTLYVGKGKKDKINKIDIVGFLIKTGQVEKEQIGRIDVLPGWSYVAVRREVSAALLQRIRGAKIKGVKTVYALAE